MIDLHCHLLPGVDDGPRTLQEAVDLSRLAAEDGIRRAVTTPHLIPRTASLAWPRIVEAHSQLVRAVEALGLPLAIELAAEVRVGGELIELVGTGRLPFLGSLAGRNVVLLEFPHTATLPCGSENLVVWLVQQGITPMIAHPERNRTFQRDPDRLLPFLDCGCLLQVTAGSLLGQFGDDAQNLALNLLDAELISILASDAHDTVARPPNLQAAGEFVRNRAGAGTAHRLIVETPASIISSRF